MLSTVAARHESRQGARRVVALRCAPTCGDPITVTGKRVAIESRAPFDPWREGATRDRAAELLPRGLRNPIVRAPERGGAAATTRGSVGIAAGAAGVTGATGACVARRRLAARGPGAPRAARAGTGTRARARRQLTGLGHAIVRRGAIIAGTRGETQSHQNGPGGPAGNTSADGGDPCAAMRAGGLGGAHMGTTRRTSDKTRHRNEPNTAPTAGWSDVPLLMTPTVSSRVVGAW